MPSPSLSTKVSTSRQYTTAFFHHTSLIAVFTMPRTYRRAGSGNVLYATKRGERPLIRAAAGVCQVTPECPPQPEHFPSAGEAKCSRWMRLQPVSELSAGADDNRLYGQSRQRMAWGPQGRRTSPRTSLCSPTSAPPASSITPAGSSADPEGPRPYAAATARRAGYRQRQQIIH